MKPKSARLFQAPLIVVIATAATTALSFATSGTWTSNVSGNWLDSTKWTGGNVPNASGEIATLGGDWTGQTITVTAATVGQILASDSASLTGGLTISGGTLTLANGASSPIISTGSNSNFNESAALRLKISSVLDGTNGFERQGSGYLDLSGVTNIFTGTIKLTAPTSGGGSFTVINSDANLGNSANVITAATAAQPVGFYNDASAGSFTLNAARTITTSGTGDFWVKNKLGANMTIAGKISGTARLRKNDSGTLTLTGANDYTGGTLLDGGTLALAGGDNRLLSTSTVTFNSASTLDVGSTSQTLGGLGLLGAGQTNTISGAGGTLIFNAASDQTWNTTVTGTTVNMAGLSNLTVNRAAGSFQINSNALNVVNTVNLAKAGTNTINAANVRFGGGGNFAGQNVLVGLGQNNNINASGEFVIGFFQGSGNVSFQSGLTNAALTVRGAGGIGATPIMTVGSTNSGNQSSVGILNLTNGSLDVQATDFYVARHFANAGGTSATGTVTMPAGSVVATTLNLAAKTGATTGAPTLTGTFNQGGGTVTAATVNLGLNTNAESPNLIANYNLAGGTLYATTIQGSGATYGGSTVRNLSINGGTLRNLAGGDLSVNGLATTATGRINVIAGASGATFNADATRTITLGANTRLDGSGAISKTGNGTLLINGVSTTYTGTLTVNAGTLGGETSLGGNVSIGGSGTLAPGNSPGTMTVAGNLDIAGTYAYQFTGGGSLADLVNVGGTINLTGSSIAWDNLGTYTLNDKFTLFGYTAGNLTGTFTGYSDDMSYAFGGGEWLINYNDSSAGLNGGSGTRFVTITAIPEPGATILVGGLGTLALLRRRRLA